MSESIKITDFKNKYKNKRIFIIGNGPSLNKTDLNLIKNEYSIAMNRISQIYNSTNWRPSFFVCTTSNISDSQWKKDILETVDTGVPTFIWDQLAEHFRGYDHIFPMVCTNGMERSENPPIEWWSYDINERVTKFGTSMIVALQIAVYMGFKEIYIVGADLGFQKSMLQKILYRLRLNKLAHLLDKNHFSGSYGTPGAGADSLNKNMVAAHKLTKRACDKCGVKVFNATVGGSLEVYNRIDFSKIQTKK